MKARLLLFEDSLYLFLCTGKIKTVSYQEAFEFLSNYENSDYYNESAIEDDLCFTIESHPGHTIAIVDEDSNLRVVDSSFFRKILSEKDVDFLSVSEFAELHGKSIAMVRRLCQNGRIPGVIYKGKSWLIPKSSPYPADERVRRH